MTGSYELFHHLYRHYLEKKSIREFPEKRKKIIEGYSDKFKCLNIGGGVFLKENWRVLDYVSPQYAYNRELIDFNINLLESKPWPIENASYDYAYSSHCLEHLTDQAGLNCFRQIYRILKPGGVFRLTLPDIDKAYTAYKNEDLDFFINNVNAKDTSSLLSYFLDFFTNRNISNVDTRIFDNDLKTLTKADFLNKYIPSEIDIDTHDFSGHINWYNFEKIRNFAELSGFSDTILSGRGKSVAEEMRTPQFDHKPGDYCIYVDIIK